ncbi:MAG: T9SS type A sorting domain-containing protein [Chitinophagales bacterium]
MKHYLLLFIAITIGVNCHAQTDFRFADSTAQWNVLNEVPGQGVEWTSVYTTGHDTLTNGYNYQTVQSCFWFYRRDSLNRIYSIGDSLIYDFGAQVGDSVHSFWCDGFVKGMYHSKVLSVDTVNWGKPRRRLFLSNGQIWVDGIGNVNADPLTNLSSLPAHSISAINLLCFFENGQMQYHRNGYDTCYSSNINLKINEPVAEYRYVKAYPNPADNIASFQLFNFQEDEDVQFRMSTPTGQCVLDIPFQTSILKIPTTTFARGMYFYSITSKGQKAASGKIILE